MCKLCVLSHSSIIILFSLNDEFVEGQNAFSDINCSIITFLMVVKHSLDSLVTETVFRLFPVVSSPTQVELIRCSILIMTTLSSGSESLAQLSKSCLTLYIFIKFDLTPLRTSTCVYLELLCSSIGNPFLNGNLRLYVSNIILP